MTIPGRRLSLLTTLTLSIFLAANAATNDPDKPLTNHSLSGLVRDIACPIQNKEFTRDCALACARQGSPLAILTDEGTMYLPISGSMPDSDQRSKLLPFVGKYVRVVGEVYERKGLHAIVIKQLNEDPSIQSQGDASQPE